MSNVVDVIAKARASTVVGLHVE
eukprot:COSAG01_NODE_57147_length_314_cov_0.716279_1_plen_22_part_10